MSSSSLRASILLLAFAAVLSGVTAKPPFFHGPKDSDTRCLTELGLTPEDLRERHKNGENEKEDCFGACILKEKGVLTSSGEIDATKAADDLPPFVPKDEAQKSIDKCAAESKGANDCETAANYHKCMRREHPHPHPHHPRDPEFEKVLDTCKSENNSSNDDAPKRASSDDKEDCFAACIGKGLGVLKEDGSLAADKVLEKRPPHIDEEKMKTAVTACESLKGANACETVVLLRNCFKSNDIPVHSLGRPAHKFSHGP